MLEIEYIKMNGEHKNMKTGWKEVTKKEWYCAGGFKNSTCIRKATKNGNWQYYIITDNGIWW